MYGLKFILFIIWADFVVQEDAKELQLMAWQRDKRLRDVYVNHEDENDEGLAGKFMDLIQPKRR